MQLQLIYWLEVGSGKWDEWHVKTGLHCMAD